MIEDWFYALTALVRSDAAIGERYKQLNRLFHRLLAEHTAFTRARLVGAFARLDYLLKEGQADQGLQRQANDLRVALKHISRGEVADEKLTGRWQSDAYTLARLISFLTHEPIPEDIPVCDRPAAPLRPATACDIVPYLRLLVTHWDDRCVYGTLEGDGVREVTVCYADGNKLYPYDWTYLRKLWQRGTQVNLIRPLVRDGIYYPELIIIEPDYLIDISQIARCFAVYAESPLVQLIDRLTPDTPTEPMLLGFMAGQLLDEELHDMQRPYGETALDFYQHNAMSLLCTEMGPDFHTRAMQQRANIHNAVSVQLPMMADRYQKEKAMVEPSFVSEMLGLQGRMDFLQTDMRVLIEQKSGKAAFVPYDPEPDNPKPRDEHYVQMLLYMALVRYNHRQTYERNNRELHAFLLYSAYPNALVGLGFAPELLFRAFKLRNRLVAQDRWLTAHGFSLLTALTPERLNEKGVQGKLWDVYVRPRLEETLLPIQRASLLELKYYLRLLRFVALEHQLSKLGNQTKENSGFAALWHDSTDEKRQAGNIYDGLHLIWPRADEESTWVDHVKLAFPEAHDTDTANFRLGDVVLLYSYAPDEQPDAREHILYRGSIQDITPQGLTVRLRNAQTDAKVLAGDANRLWAVEHDFVESTHTALYQGIHSFLSAPQERRDLLMMQRNPAVDETRTLRGSYGAFDELMLRVKQAKDLFLLIGPPGTGKTSFGMFNTLLEELQEPDSQVLVMSYTNRAVDEISSKLHGAIDFIRIGSDANCATEYREHLFSERVKKCANRAELESLIRRTRVFVGTTTAFSSARPLFQLKRFSLAIVDEAGQILEPSLLALLSMQHEGASAIRKFVLIGDHKQLPAVVQQRQQESEVTDEMLREIGLTDCRLSLFERLLWRYGGDPAVTYMLTRQGRMHPDIARFPNEAFYGGKLQAVPLPHQQEESPQPRVTFYDVLPREGEVADKANQAEADVIARLVREIYEREWRTFSETETVGIIVPYRNQIATIRNTIDRLGIPALHGITIDTVERYQGSQRHYIIYGFTVKYFYQLRFLTDATFVEGETVIDRKLNVAMTRAQEYLMLVGNARLLKTNDVFARLIDFAYLRK